MSKRVKIGIKCPHCGQQYAGDFFRTYWGESENMRANLMNDNVNIATCPYCGHKFHLPLAMMYVDVQARFAVWWEPNPDPGIDSDSREYARMFGAKSFYATAPRIADWEEFKRTINKYYRGEFVGGPIEKMDLSALGGSTVGKKNSGCLGAVALFVICGAVLFALL